MLVLTKGKPKAQRVLLGKDAWIEVRPATQFEMEEAHANVSRLLAGIIAGSEAADALTAFSATTSTSTGSRIARGLPRPQRGSPTSTS